MAITAQRLRVEVDADVSKAKQGLQGLEAEGKKTPAWMGAAKAAVVGFGLAGAAAFTGKIIGAASDLNETLSKTGVVFGPQSDQVVGYAQEMADSFGLPKTAILDAASGFGLLGKAAGLTGGDLTGMSTNLSTLAADAASFYNVPLEQALGDFGSALSGESEPVKKYGVLMNEAAVEAEAVALGVANVGDKLTEGQKVQARASLLMKGMADASGDLARTQDSVSNRVRELKGRIGNLAAEMGAKLLPAAGAVLGALIGLVDGIPRIVQAVRDWAAENQGLFAVLKIAAGAAVAFFAALGAMKVLGAVRNALLAARTAVLLFNAALLANPIGLIIAAAVALGAAVYLAYQNFAPFREFIDGLIAKGKELLAFFQTGDINGALLAAFAIEEDHPFVGFLVTARDTLLDFRDRAVTALTELQGIFATAWAALQHPIELFMIIWNGTADSEMSIVDRVLLGIQTAAPSIITALTDLGRNLVSWITDNVGPALAALGSFIGGVVGWVLGTGLPLLLSTLTKWGTALVEWIGPMVAPALAAIGKFLGSVAGWILGTGLPLLIAKLKEWGGALVAWIGPMVGPALKSVGEFLGKITGWLLFTGLPLLVGALVKLGAKLIPWIIDAVPPALVAIAGFIGSIVAWAVGTGLPMLVRALTDLGMGMAEGLISAFRNSPVVQAIGDKMQDVKQRIADKITEIVTYFRELPGRAIAAVGDIGSKFASVGRAVINGIKDGIGDAAAGLARSVVSAVGDAVAAGKRALGIRSPSKVTEKEVGKPFGQGITAGIMGAQAGVQNAAVDMVTDAADKARDAARKTQINAAWKIAQGLTGTGATPTGTTLSPAPRATPTLAASTLTAAQGAAGGMTGGDGKMAITVQGSLIGTVQIAGGADVSVMLAELGFRVSALTLGQLGVVTS